MTNHEHKVVENTNIDGNGLQEAETKKTPEQIVDKLLQQRVAEGNPYVNLTAITRALQEAEWKHLDQAAVLALVNSRVESGVLKPKTSLGGVVSDWQIVSSSKLRQEETLAEIETVRADSEAAKEDKLVDTKKGKVENFYTENHIKRGELSSFVRDELNLPVMAEKVVDDDYTVAQLTTIFDEYVKYLGNPTHYQAPSLDAWGDTFPPEDFALLAKPENVESPQEESPKKEEKQPSFFKRLFTKNKKPQAAATQSETVRPESNLEAITAWKESRRGKSFMQSLVDLNSELAHDAQDVFDQENQEDIERAIVAQELFDTHYAKVRNIFDHQLKAMTGYTMYDIFNLGDEGRKMFVDFGKWVVRQAYLDAGTSQGMGRLERIIILDASAQTNANFLKNVVSPKRLQELRDNRDAWKAGYKFIGFESSAAREKLGPEKPTGLFAEARGVFTARERERYVAVVEADFQKAPEVKNEIERQRRQIIAELEAVNSLVGDDRKTTSPVLGFATLLRSMIGKVESAAKDSNKVPTEKEVENAERTLAAVKKLQAERVAGGLSAYAFGDELEQNRADAQIMELEQQVTTLVQAKFRQALAEKVRLGKPQVIKKFNTEIRRTVERLAKSLTSPAARRNATVAILNVLAEQASHLAEKEQNNPPQGAQGKGQKVKSQSDVLTELEEVIEWLRNDLR